MEAQLDRSDQPQDLESSEPVLDLVPIDQLQPADSPRRAGEDEQHAQRLAESETEWPPILVRRSTMQVIDGMHRLRAAKEKGCHSIKVEFFDGSEEAAFVEAVRANIRHGLPLCLEDRRSAAERIVAAQRNMSDRAIAECTGLSTKTVGGIRRRLDQDSSPQEVRVGKDGRRHPLSAADGRRQAAKALTAEPFAPLRQIAKAAGVSVGTAHDVRERIRRGEDPVVPRDRGKRPKPDVRKGLTAPVTDTVVTAPEKGRKMKNMQARLQSLRKDPSLRLSESGRELLRWLHLHHRAQVKYPHVVDNIPPHLAAIVAELATQCSEMWRNLAQELEERASQQD
ncbi:ParB N-terminal domain-containing protein [Streptomyces sp. HU2014]|uniref:ParB N-terminal domain-containing protein n=1 Tax=Streptomyces sp. HU2014 TaxID=2939414 RepID=UPI00200DA465|nr:ParB N-terminal domain-containing protein [Streptomyces sp. HU2014]UQI45744.1 ParB N-terminal domain-containing protein [Streptomyces sp. HU2014]